MSEAMLTEGVNPPRDESFTVARYNQTGFHWETRKPGTDAEETWESGEHEHETLTAAIEAALPAYARYDLTLDQAGRLCLALGLVVHTGVEIEPLHE